MIRDGQNTENMTINVKLKNGELYVDKDITSSPLNEGGKLLGFWFNKTTLRMYPMSEIEYFEFNIGSDE